MDALAALGRAGCDAETGWSSGYAVKFAAQLVRYREARQANGESSMTQIVLLVLSAAAGFVGYREAAKFERQSRKRLLGLPTWGCGVVFGVVGLVAAFFASAFVLGALIVFVTYDRTAQYERQQHQGPLGMTAWVWGVGSGIFAASGAAVTSTFFWGLLCGFCGLGGALYLALDERNMLLAEVKVWRAENARLLAERRTTTQSSGSTSSPRPPLASVRDTATAARADSASSIVGLGFGSSRTPSAKRQGSRFGENDLLPRR